MRVNAFLLAAIGSIGVTGAQAVEVAKPKSPAAIDYVKACGSQGDGFFYIPGSDTCLAIGGFVRFDAVTGRTSTGMQNFNDPNVWTGGVESAHEGPVLGSRPSMNRYLTAVQASLQIDSRTNTDLGLLRTYTEAHFNTGTGSTPPTTVELEKAFVQWGGLTAGRAQSYFDFFTGFDDPVYFGPSVSNRITNLLAYSATLGSGLSATLSLEDATSRRADNGTDTYADGQKIPDIVANLNLTQAWGKAQVMAAYHQDYGDVQDDTLPVSWQKNGFALGAGIMIKLPQLGKGDRLWLQTAYALGAVDYTGADPYWATDFADRSNTGVFPRRDWSVTAGLHHGFSAQYAVNLLASYHDSTGWVWRSTFTGGNAIYGPKSADYRQTDLGVSFDWIPRVDNLLVRFGAEYRRVDYATANNYFNRRPTNATRSSDDGLVGYLRITRTFGAGDDD